MGDILPIRASLLCSILMVSYQKGKRCLKATVLILKMIRIPMLYDKPISSKIDLSDPYNRSSGDLDDLIVGNDWWWFLFSFIPFACTWVGFGLFGKPSNATVIIFVYSHISLHAIALYSVRYWHRDMSPFRLMGAMAKFMIEVIPMIVAAALPHLLESDEAYFFLLLSCTTYFYTFVHFMHAAYDIGFKDVFLGLAMVVLVRMLNEELLVGALIFCLGLSFYRYVRYCAPELPIHRKKEMEFPC